MIDSGLVGSTDWEGYHESRRCSRDTYPESYITEYTLVYEDKRRFPQAGDRTLEDVIEKVGNVQVSAQRAQRERERAQRERERERDR